MKPVKVFLSSTYRDKELRDAVYHTIQSLPGFECVLIEDTPAAGRAIEERLRQEIRQSELFLVLRSTDCAKRAATSRPRSSTMRCYS